jgi:hypothetical protein
MKQWKEEKIKKILIDNKIKVNRERKKLRFFFKSCVSKIDCLENAKLTKCPEEGKECWK